MINTFNHHRLLVKAILEKATHYPWTLQGFGMLRLYLTDELRIHVWDSDFSIEGSTRVHDHPWDFHSEVISGCLVNRRYHVLSPSTEEWRFPTHREAVIRAGDGAYVKHETREVCLVSKGEEQYLTGGIYTQKAEEVHETSAVPGTVTLVHRGMRSDRPRDDARVYIPKGALFVSAAPRTATFQEVSKICEKALSRWG